ncbi:MAG TPA: hypothetical protein VGJ60_37000, partial [Chloroflexota bacterium]
DRGQADARQRALQLGHGDSSESGTRHTTLPKEGNPRLLNCSPGAVESWFSEEIRTQKSEIS